VRISRRGRIVTTLAGDADDEGARHLMARATGNFKRGNERR
jgi:hypothetical protein